MVQTREKLVSTEAERYLLLYMISVLLIITTLVIVFFIIFQKRKNKILIEKFRQKQKFEEELSKTQQEIQEETLRHVGRELHDNIGQMLVMSTMQMNAAVKIINDDGVKIKVSNAAETLKSTLDEVRALLKEALKAKSNDNSQKVKEILQKIGKNSKGYVDGNNTKIVSS